MIQLQLIINGKLQHFDATLSVAQLLGNMTLKNKRIAVERNGQIVPRSEFAYMAIVN